MFKYLFKSSYLRNPANFNIKKIDIICLDDDNSVKRKYDEFIRLNGNKYRFKNGSFIDMLKRINQNTIYDREYVLNQINTILAMKINVIF